MRRSGVGWMRSGCCCGINAIKPRVSATDSATPIAPPINDNNTLSVSSWRTSCPRVAPIDRPTRDLALAHEASRDQQVGHVCARDQQHQADHAISTTRAVENSLRSGE